MSPWVGESGGVLNGSCGVSCFARQELRRGGFLCVWVANGLLSWLGITHMMLLGLSEDIAFIGIELG